jgi:hypothetical protein
MSFTQKLLQANISLSQGNFSGGGNSISVTATESGAGTINGNALATILRMSAHIEVIGGVSSGQLELAIYGLPLETMNQMSNVGYQFNEYGKNTISLLAGDSASGMTLVYQGKIFDAYVDANNQPQVCFRLNALPSGVSDAVTPVPPISLQGSQDVAQMMGKLAQQMGLTLENNNVNVKLSNPYYGGSPWTQAVQIARHANINMAVDRGTMVIVPSDQPRTSGGTPLVSAETGMVGYPAFRQKVIVVKTLFTPAIQILGEFQVKSTLTPANGTWKSFHLIHELECAMPHGRWFTTIEAVPSDGSEGPPGA